MQGIILRLPRAPSKDTGRASKFTSAVCNHHHHQFDHSHDQREHTIQSKSCTPSGLGKQHTSAQPGLDLQLAQAGKLPYSSRSSVSLRFSSQDLCTSSSIHFPINHLRHEQLESCIRVSCKLQMFLSISNPLAITLHMMMTSHVLCSMS